MAAATKAPQINFEILDAIRGIAALYVCIAHCRGVLWIGGALYSELHPISTWSWRQYAFMGMNMVTRLATEFVIVFFVLSGFSIAYSLRRTSSLLRYAQRRFIRLYPPYVVAFLWGGLVVTYIQWAHPDFFTGRYTTLPFIRLQSSLGYFQPIEVLKTLLYVPTTKGIILPFWSLTYEVIFYALAPLFLVHKRAYYIGSVVLKLAAFVLPPVGSFPLTVVSSFFLEYNFYFMLGVLLHDKLDVVTRLFSGLSVKAFLVTTIGTFGLLLGTNVYFRNSNWITLGLASALGALMIVFFLVHQVNVWPLRIVGRFSYTLYITHFATVLLYMSLVFSFTSLQPPHIYNNLVFIPAIFLCLAVAYGQYWLIERRTKETLSRLRVNRLAGSPPPEVARTAQSAGGS